jgi:hypothetical protein
MGGLARRVSYTKAFRGKFTAVPLLMVDTGNFMADDRSTHGELRFDARLKNELVLKAFDQFTVDVANLSWHDLFYFSKLKTAARPASLDKYVSANATSETPAAFTPKQFTIREVAARHGEGAKKVLVAFVGLTEARGSARKGFNISDPVEAARRVVPEARQKADLVIALAYASTAEAVRLAREVPGIDVVMAGNGEMFTPPIRLGQTLIVFTPYETRTLGELRFYMDAQGKFSTRERFISLDDAAGEDPEALRISTASGSIENDSYRSNQELLNEWLASVSKASNAAGAGYVSSSACAQCHSAQYIKWSNSGHARATDALVLKKVEFEASCFACHATGSAAGPQQRPVLASVHCEQCHGPGAEHAVKPAKGYGRIKDMKAACSACHTAETSPDFDLQTYWEKIKH